MRQEFTDHAVALGGQPAEHVLEVGKWIVSGYMTAYSGSEEQSLNYIFI